MSEVPYHKLRGITARKIIRALETDGFLYDRQRGSHQIYVHPDGRRVVIPMHHKGQTFPVKTLKAIIAAAGWNMNDLQRLKIIPKRGL